MGKTSVFGEFAEVVRKWAKKVGEGNASLSLPLPKRPAEDAMRLSDAALVKMSEEQQELASALLRGDAFALKVIFARRPNAATEKFPKNLASFLIEAPALTADNLVSGRTPLMIAASRNRPEAMKALLALSTSISNQAQPRDADTYTKTDASATTSAIPDLNLNEQDDDGRTALAHAAESSPECVALLLTDKRCDASVKDIHGDTALVWAASFAQPDSVRRLARRAAPEDAERAFRRALEETEIVVRAQGSAAAATGWACLDELSEFAHEIDAEDAVRLAAGKARQRLPQHTARLEARELQAEIAGRKAAAAKKAEKPGAGNGESREGYIAEGVIDAEITDTEALSGGPPGRRRRAL